MYILETGGYVTRSTRKHINAEQQRQQGLNISAIGEFTFNQHQCGVTKTSYLVSRMEEKQGSSNQGSAGMVGDRLRLGCSIGPRG